MKPFKRKYDRKLMNIRTILPIFLISFSCNLFACTGLFLKNAADGYVYARTLEFGQDLKSQFLFVPRNYSFAAPGPVPNTKGLAWKSTFAVIGANAFGLANFVDGVNEKGLAGGLFYFPGFAGYQEVTPEQYAQSLPMWQLLTWILTSCATVQEVKTTVPTLFISNAVLSGTTDNIPAHLIVHDSSGKSVVIECIAGKLALHDNPIGTITNAPAFDWHMTNLRNYINLSPVDAPSKIIAGITLAPLGQGSGMVGLPGSFTPPDRFVRITAFSHAAPKAKTELEGITQAFHILNNFDIPIGSVTSSTGTTEYTQWTSACDMKNKIFYCKTYDNFQLQKIDLMKIDLNSSTHTMIPLNNKNSIQDATPAVV